MRTIIPTLLVILLPLAGCGRGPTAAPADVARESASADVEASLGAGGVTLVNHTDHGIAYAVWNPHFLGLMGVCQDPGPDCVRLAAGASVVVPESEFHGWSPAPGTESQPGAQALEVRWWHVLPDDGGAYRATEVRVIPLVL